MHAEAARDPILSTQRIRKVKISMVGIDKLKVRLHCLALAHVSHFFPEREPWALKQSTHFSIFERFEILHLPDLLVSLAPPSPSLTNFDVFSACFALIYSFLLYVRGVRASSTRVCRSAQFNRALPIAAQCLSFGAPPHIFSPSHFAYVFMSCRICRLIDSFTYSRCIDVRLQDPCSGDVLTYHM